MTMTNEQLEAALNALTSTVTALSATVANLAIAINGTAASAAIVINALKGACPQVAAVVPEGM